MFYPSLQHKQSGPPDKIQGLTLTTKTSKMACLPPNKKRLFNASISSSTESTNSGQNYTFFSFPPEIRNEIMALALTGAHVHLRSKSYSTKLRSHKASMLVKAPAVNFLATCQQAYKEGHAMFYNANTFHMPAGSLEEMMLLLNKIKPEHLAMMKHVELKFGLLDLTPSVLIEVEAWVAEAVKYHRSQEHFWRSRVADNVIYPEEVRTSLTLIWKGKLHAARSSFSTLEDLRVRIFSHDPAGGSNSVLTLQGRNADGLIGIHPSIGIKPLHVNSQSNRNPADVYEQVLENLPIHVSFKARESVYPIIRRKGWKGFKKWLNAESVLKLEQQEKQTNGLLSRMYFDLGFDMETD